MNRDKICAECGHVNRDDANWCARCLTPFEDDEWADEWDEPDLETSGPRSSTALRTIALVLILVLAASYAGVNLFAALRQDEAVSPRRGLVDERGFRFLAIDPATNTPVRYDPCTPIHYVFNPDHSPRGGERDVHEAVALTAEASGIRFVFDGLTDEPVRARREVLQPERYGQRWPPLLIGWMPHDSSIFDIDGVGAAGSTIERNADGRLVYVTGSIVLNGAEQLANGFAPGRTWGKVVLHELGHVLGLDHVEDPAQVMHPNLVSSPAVWGEGDRAALRQLGSLGGCLEVPEPP